MKSATSAAIGVPCSQDPETPTVVEHSRTERRVYLAILLLLVALLGSVYPLLVDSVYRGSADFHAAIEMTGSLLGLIAGLALITRFYALGNRFYLLVGLAFFVNGTEDFVHGLLGFQGFKGLVGEPTSSLKQFIPGTYVTGRLLMGILLLLAPFADSLLGKSRNSRQETKWTSLVVLLVTVAATALAFTIPLPRFMFPDRFLSRPVDLLSAAVLLAAFVGFIWRYLRQGDVLTWWVSLSIAVNIVGQVLMSFSRELYDPFFDIAHVYKVFGYAIPLLGFSLYQIGVIREQKQTEEELHAQREELVRERTNLQTIVDASQIGMLLVDENTQVVRVNDVIAQLAGKDKSELLGYQPGDGLCCIHASETPAGCGHAAACPDCPVRNAVEQVIENGQTIRNAELTMRLTAGAEERQLFLAASASPLFLEGKKYALLALLDITDRKKREKRDSLLNALQRQLLNPASLAEKTKLVADAVTEMVDADFTRIWLTQPGDRCDRCIHNQASDDVHVCEYRDRCLHLMASSGRYTHIDGETHRRVPFGCYKIGRIAADNEARFLTNQVTTDPRVHNHQWAAELGLVSFAGYQLQDANGRSIGVMALFAAHPLSQEVDEFLDNIAHLASQVILADQAEAERKKMQEKLVETSRLAGMAEVATGVLHNVGNVLNSVNVSSQMVANKVKDSRITGLAKANALIAQHADDLGLFFTSDERGRLLPEYLQELSKELHAERDSVLEELDVLMQSIEHIKEIVSMQQSLARVVGVVEPIDLADIADSALKVNDAGLLRHGVELERDYNAIPPVLTDRHKVLQILVNLISNAKYALSDSGRDDRRLTIRINPPAEGRVRVEVEDNGVGIAREDLSRIFQHGFTTKKDGHGFGLHSSALAAKELGGALSVHSNGPGQGATFKLELPLSHPENEMSARMDWPAPSVVHSVAASGVVPT